MREIKCIFCDTFSDRVVMEENGFAAKSCPTCRLIYVSPRPTLAELQALYSQDHAHISAATHIAGRYRRRLVARHALRLMRPYVTGGSILEIGSGSGYFLDEARRWGFDPYGIELNQVLAEFTRTQLGIPCEEQPLDLSLFEGRRFDVVYHRDVISHFYDPLEEFTKIRDKLGDGGLHVFETGNLGDVDPKHYRLFPEFQFPDHLFFFSEKNLGLLLERTGFELVKMHNYSIVAMLRWDGAMDRLTRGLGRLAKARSKDETAKEDRAAKAAQPARGFKVSELARNVVNYGYYFSRYRLGSALPKERRPQTIIVIARKV